MERTDRRTGLESWDGRPLFWRLAPRSHTHYDAAQDRRWVCVESRCIRHEACPMPLDRTEAPGLPCSP